MQSGAYGQLKVAKKHKTYLVHHISDSNGDYFPKLNLVICSHVAIDCRGQHKNYGEVYRRSRYIQSSYRVIQESLSMCFV